MIETARAFENGKAFIAFLTAGDPDLKCTERYIEVMANAGADLIEIGVPFSDPIAEGEVIQAANVRALKNDVHLDGIFDMCGRLRQRGLLTPLALLTYLNPVFNYGYETFFERCARCSVGAVIVPDCPLEEQGPVKEAAAHFGVDVISLIAPTSNDRIETIAASAGGFIYLVSSMGVTGVRGKIETDIAAIVKRVRSVTDTPVCVGFGVARPSQARDLSAECDGVIVGSAIVRIIEKHGDAADGPLREYVAEMKAACLSAQ